MNYLQPSQWAVFGDENKSFWFPEQASTFASEIDLIFYAILAISVVFFALIVIGMIIFVWKYRERPGYQGSPEALHNNTLEVAWTVIPTLIVVWIFVRGVYGYIDMMTPPTETIDIQVKAQKWNWTFTYPNGAVTTELHLPNNQAVKLLMRSEDVIHSLYVPAFRVKTDIVPGRLNVMWFQPTKEGVYDLNCTEYCGTRHSLMQAVVTVESEEKYTEWVTKAAQPPREDPVKWGQWLYERQGCKGCHSIDGSLVIGPSFKGTFGGSVKTNTGETIPMNEEYIRNSILYPQKQAREEYVAKISQMNSYQGKLKDDEIKALIAFIQSLAK